jgi:hypothetical protein
VIRRAKLAVKAAHEKAEALAKALGQSIGKAQLIEEAPEAGDRSPYGLYNTMVQNEMVEYASVE